MTAAIYVCPELSGNGEDAYVFCVEWGLLYYYFYL